MKSKTSITLSQHLLQAIDRMAGKNGNRSEIIETAVREFIQRIERMERDRRDLDILNRSARRLAAEAKDALRYQVRK